MTHDHRAMTLLAAALLCVTPGRAQGQTPDPVEDARRPGTRGTRQATPPRRTRPAPAVRPRDGATPGKAKQAAPRKPPAVRLYIGADLSFFPGADTHRRIYGLGDETMPRTAAIRQLHGSALRFTQGLRLMNGVLDVRFAVGVHNQIPVGGRRALWGSDFGLAAGIRLHRIKRFEIQLFNAYRLLVMSGLDKDYAGIGVHLEVGLGGAYRIDERHWVELRLGYCRQQLRYQTHTDAQVGGLETPSGVLFQSHMIMLSFAFLHFR